MRDATPPTRELTSWVPILILVQLYLTIMVAVDLLLPSYIRAGVFFLAGLANLWVINRGLGPKEQQHG